MPKTHREKSNNHTSSYPKSETDRLLKIINLAIQKEISEANKYKIMWERAEDEYTAGVLKTLYFDECKHKCLLEELYISISQTPLPEPSEQPVPIVSPLTQYNQCIIDEIETARFYNDMLLMLNNPKDISVIHSLINDEQNHAILNLYLLAKTN